MRVYDSCYKYKRFFLFIFPKNEGAHTRYTYTHNDRVKENIFK